MRSPSLAVLSFCFLALACESPRPPQEPPVGSAPSATAAAPEPVVASASSTPTAIGPAPSAITLLHRWNDALTHHDSHALADLYAANVSFYGQKIAGFACAAKKATAFASTPDYAQSIAHEVLMRDGNGGTYAEFDKTWTAHGKTITAPAYVYFDHGHIVAEGDGASPPTVRWNWCAVETPLGTLVPRGSAAGDYKVSPLDAIESALRSTHLQTVATRTHASHVKVIINPPVEMDTCPYLCSGREDSPCPAKPCDGKTGRCAAYKLSIADADTSKILEDIEVDAMTKVLYWHESGTLVSEPLTAP